ncbi:hypothetical protein [Glaesserella sp.]|uniref:hypothetical protein n=1 Tax=Glaesserella sp. TaxID=2094731 RepID=UPI0035A042BB
MYRFHNACFPAQKSNSRCTFFGLCCVGAAESLYVAEGVQLIDTPNFPSEIFDGANAVRNLLVDLKAHLHQHVTVARE